MRAFRIGPAALVAAYCLLLFIACGDEPTAPPTSGAADSPLDEAWFEELFGFCERMQGALEDPATRVETRLLLEAGSVERALAKLGVEESELAVFLARLESLEDDLESKWPEFAAVRALPYGVSWGEDLELITSGPRLVDRPDERAKNPEYVCAALELYQNLGDCVRNPHAIARAVCMYAAYLRYLEHLSLGCGG